ncbi:invasion associated locus B family protein [Kaistia algarum]|uniref:invasion associated locus B family protein n=1 Tax=Kaistia algarum TaxID=2083279 RepID=UPI002252338E|nr:invasion associated locus B family protein [Kaistia algarum]MCX5512388.1 invasion associated locus B family protein [Kaistia algarum]
MKANAAASAFRWTQTGRRIACLAGVALAATLALAPFGGASAQGVSKGKNGDWETRCDKPPGAQEEVCSIMQFVSAEDRPNVGLAVVALKTVDKKAQILRVLAPLGVYLKRGLGVSVGRTVSFKSDVGAGDSDKTVSITVPDNVDAKQGDILVRADTNEFLRIVSMNGRVANVQWNGAKPANIAISEVFQNLGAVGFDRCLPDGCVLDVDLTPTVLDMLRKGTTALFYVYQTPDDGFGIPVSLNGFAAGFDALP